MATSIKPSKITKVEQRPCWQNEVDRQNHPGDSLDVLFVVPSYRPDLGQESIGSLILAKKLQMGGFSSKILRYWEVDSEMNDFNNFTRSFISIIKKINPKVISFYCREAEYHISVHLSSLIKEMMPDSIILFGGPQAELTAKETLKSFNSIDYVCCGEGENTILPLIDSLLSNGRNGTDIASLDGLVYRDDNQMIHQNKFPAFLPDDYSRDYNYYDLIPSIIIENSKSAVIDAGRGCPFDCVFCSTKTFWKRRFRLRNIENTIQEIEYVIQNYGIKHFSFAHDLFTANKRRVLKFCSILQSKKLNITWDCSSRLDTIDNETLNTMVLSGMTGIYYGIESGSQRMQTIINKKLNLTKGIDIVKYTVEKGVNTTVSFIFGFPEESENDLNETLSMMRTLRNIGVDDIQLHPLLFESGTALYEKYKNNLDLSDESRTGSYAFGYKELYPLVKEYPVIFPCFFKYEPPLPSNLEYLYIFHVLFSKCPKTFGAIADILQQQNITYVAMYRLFENSCRSMLKRLEKSGYNMNNLTVPIFVSLVEKFIGSVVHDENPIFLLSQDNIETIMKYKEQECSW